MKFNITCPAIISQFKYHAQLKESLLEKISETECSTVVEAGDNITKSDWYIDTLVKRKYTDILLEPLIDHLKESYSSLGFEGFEIHNIWFQQYEKHSTHSWHSHQAAQYTNVYYLELPFNGPKTELIDPINPNNIITLNVVEGDIVSFPAFIFHRSPPNIDNERKTVIAFNSSFLKSNAPVVQWRGQESSKL